MHEKIPNNPLMQIYNQTENRITIILKTIKSEFLYIEVRLTNQNSQPLETGHKINLPLVID